MRTVSGLNHIYVPKVSPLIKEKHLQKKVQDSHLFPSAHFHNRRHFHIAQSFFIFSAAVR